MLLTRKQRIQKLDELHRQSNAGPVELCKLIEKLRSLPASSEDRFCKLDNSYLGVQSMKTAAIRFGVDAGLEVKRIVDAKDLPRLSCDSIFKYSGPEGGSFSDYKRDLHEGKGVVFVALESETVIGYALIDLNGPKAGHEIKIIDVEAASRRSAGFHTAIRVEGQSFEVGVAHLIVTSIVNHFKARLHTDATHGSSRYVFKSVGFTGYSANNPCLLETRRR